MILEEIKRLCEERGVSIARVEREAGLPNATIRKWEHSDPRVRNLKAVADYFGVPVDDLIPKTY